MIAVRALLGFDRNLLSSSTRQINRNSVPFKRPDYLAPRLLNLGLSHDTDRR